MNPASHLKAIVPGHTILFLHIVIVLALSTGGLYASERLTYSDEDFIVRFDESSRKAAEETIRLISEARAELDETFGWDADFDPVVMVLLVKDSEFRRITGSTEIAAFANAENNTIVVNLQKVSREPGTMYSTLKHELAHLFLGYGIRRENLPRWLNEGISQWVSNGVSELVAPGRTTEIARATLLGRLIPLGRLESFPPGGKPLMLAYQESLSVVEYIAMRFGRRAPFEIVERLRDGDTVGDAVLSSLSIGMPELERGWHAHLKRNHTLLAYLGNNIYTLLFVLAALITAYGFARVIKRIRDYRDEDEDDDPFSGGGTYGSDN
jgi:hypothetical protein